jgi:dienelactone hydrolase
MLKTIALLMLLALAGAAHASAPQRVSFSSADGKTVLTGYLFLPQAGAQRGAAQKRPAQKSPAIVMMHGRAGAYSSLANGVYDASTLSKRHQAWGALWASQGYVALMVDGFGPRGYAQGFPRHSYDSRPEELNEVTVRPLDAAGALVYLRTRPDVDGARIGLQGWSNGGSATLATMASSGFAAAVAFYPACGLKGAFDAGYKPAAPVRVFMGTADEEVSPKRCEALVAASRAAGGDIGIELYAGATHGFDDPSTKRQRVAANAEATEDAVEKAVRFFGERLGGRTK